MPTTLTDYRVVLYRQQDGAWVAEAPGLPGCYALIETRKGALEELQNVFEMIAEEYRERGQPLPEDSTEVLHV